MKKITTVILMFTFMVSFAQESGTIKGTVYDKEFNNEPLPFANVYIDGTTIGTTTEMDGTYAFNIAPGTYTVVFSFLGYETAKKEGLVIKQGETIVLNQTLSASIGVSLNEVLIQGAVKKESVSALLAEQKKAVAIKQSIGAEELSQKGIGDAAAAVSKISGISKEGASNVYVRGLGDRYLNTTLNGLSLPSNDINKKNIDLNLFSTDIIQNVSVSKAYTAQLYGDFAAGNINIKTKEYSGSGMLEIAVGAGQNSAVNGSDFKQSEGTGNFGFYNRYNHNPYAVVLSHKVDPVAGWNPINASASVVMGNSFDFENESRLSVFATVAFDKKYAFVTGSEVDYTTVEKKKFPHVDSYETTNTTTAMVNASYRIDDRNKLSYNSLFVNAAKDQVGYYGTQGLGSNRDAKLNTDAGFYQMNVQFNQDMIYVNQLIGTHTSEDEKLELDWGVGYNKVLSREPDRKRFSLENYQYTLDDDATTNPSVFQNNSFDNQRYFETIRDAEFTSRIQFAYAVSDLFKLYVGYDGKYKKRHFENVRYGYKNVSKNLLVDPTNFDAIFNLQNIADGLVETDVFNPIFPEGGIGPTNFPGLLENTYNGKSTVVAPYASAEIKAGKWLFVPGLRMEKFNQEISWDVINLLNNPGEASINETLYLPSVNIKYSLNEDQNFRLAVSNTVSFPEFKEMAPYVYEGVTSRTGGNPDLLGRQASINYINIKDVAYSDILNLDLKYEWFISPDELIAIAGFAKQIKDPVNLVVANDATGTQRYFRTGEKATITGVELEVKKNIFKNNQGKTLLGAGFNVAYMHTEQDLYSTVSGTFSTGFDRKKEELQGASPLLLNADISYHPSFGEFIETDINVIASYFSDRIYALGSGKLGNKIEKGFTTLDLVWKNKFGKHFEFNMSAKNLLNPSVEVVRELANDKSVAIKTYKYGIDIGFQLKYKF
ncbi:MAG: TonB-dependent receptor [Flavobacteriaceae bacterium]|nr:MAG: TonB-dependent receptor [Flavobacteriaceae bacterium]